MDRLREFLIGVMCLYSLNTIAQSAVNDLPKTWEIQLMNSIVRTTLHENGTLTSQTLFGCFNCQGTGVCQVCKGTGGQYWYGLGIQPCGACFGRGACGGCGGKGYTIQNSYTQYGVTVVYDERGNMYVMGGPQGSSNDGHNCNVRSKVEVIEYTTTFGLEENENVYCPKCDKVKRRHIHVLK